METTLITAKYHGTLHLNDAQWRGSLLVRFLDDA